MTERNFRRTTAVAAALTGMGALACTARSLLHELGAAPTGPRAEQIRRSPNYRDGAFRNRLPARMLSPRETLGLMRRFTADRDRRRPAGPVPVLPPSPAAEPAPDGLHVTWYGHSSALVEIEGHRVLFDPVWSERCSPSPITGPRRLHPNPLPLEALPRLDAVVISHDHYDHLDAPTIRDLARLQTMPFVVPLGVGAHLEKWDVPPGRIVELDWDGHTTLGGIRLTATEARHYSGRGLARDKTLWASWVLTSDNRRVFYSGDSGYFPGYAAIGAAHGPFDVTLMQIGAYGEEWADIHMTPEEAVTAHHDLHGDLLVPLHWATFDLALHDWTEPADRLWHTAKASGTRLAVPRPGERIDATAPPETDSWWQRLTQTPLTTPSTTPSSAKERAA
ncbi:MBL fold metallo-hydrolase [Streptomyces sp. NPDC056463]|uniref:MBL fold metallo-hydrolase n=1 Tax=unclassified Streptomyces TaxID=2593676 RepID=UPI003678DAB9